jgi:flagellar biosynthesis protein FlhF
MIVEKFIADSAADAVNQIRSKLGPEAVVLNVRQIPADGLSRLWQKPKIEVLACRPDGPPVSTASAEHDSTEPRPTLAALPAANTQSETTQVPAFPQVRAMVYSRQSPPAQPAAIPGSAAAARWRIHDLLRGTGFSPLNVERIMEDIYQNHGETPPATLFEEIALAKTALTRCLPPLPLSPQEKPAIHIMVGASGTGKTTCLCKWLVKSVLLEARRARVWRLDGTTANLAENLSVYCEMLSVPVDRVLPTPLTEASFDLLFVDFPGVDWTNRAVLDEFSTILQQIQNSQVHLVLNAAYELSILLEQIHAFAPMNPSDLIITHLDEEQTWGKIWSVVLGTKYPLRFLGAGQNIPGYLNLATSELMLTGLFPSQ